MKTEKSTKREHWFVSHMKFLWEENPIGFVMVGVLCLIASGIFLKAAWYAVTGEVPTFF